MAEYKKNYKPLVAFFIVLITALVLGGLAASKFFPDSSMRITVIILNVAIPTLTFIIYKTGYVYWYNGVSFEDAQKATEEQRKAYAKAHLKRFSIASAIFLVFTVISIIAGLSQWLDFTVGTLALIVTAVSSVNLKL